MLAKIEVINADGTQAKVRFENIVNDSGNPIISNWLDIAMPVINNVVQVNFCFQIGDLVEVYNNGDERFISFQSKYKKTSLLFAKDEFGFHFENGDNIKYNIDTKEMSLKSTNNLKIESTATVEVKGTFIKLN